MRTGWLRPPKSKYNIEHSQRSKAPMFRFVLPGTIGPTAFLSPLVRQTPPPWGLFFAQLNIMSTIRP